MTDDVNDALALVHDSLHSHMRHADHADSAIERTMKERQTHSAWQKDRRKAFELGRAIFLSHTRTEGNFVRGSDDPHVELPPGSPLEIESLYSSRLMLYGFLRQKAFSSVVEMCVGWSLLSGALGTFVSLYHHADTSHSQAWVEEVQGHLSAILSDFKWLPTFMLGGYLAFYVQRWRQFMFAAWKIEGRLKDMAIIIGSDAVDPDDPATRSLLFTIYRYMVLAMALQYRNILPQLKDTGPEQCRRLEKLGLLTPQETLVLAPQGSRMRDAVLSWIAIEMKDNGPQKTGLLMGNAEMLAQEKLAAVRANMMYFFGNNFYPQPNTWSAFMQMMVDIYAGLLIITYPFKLFTKLENSRCGGFQVFTVLGVFCMTLCFWGAKAIARVLSNPFAGRVDTFNIDALVAGTELTLFASMRASFDSTARKDRQKVL